MEDQRQRQRMVVTKYNTQRTHLRAPSAPNSTTSSSPLSNNLALLRRDPSPWCLASRAKVLRERPSSLLWSLSSSRAEAERDVDLDGGCVLVALPPALGLGGAWILNEMPDMAAAERVDRNCSSLCYRSGGNPLSRDWGRRRITHFSILRFEAVRGSSLFLFEFPGYAMLR